MSNLFYGVVALTVTSFTVSPATAAWYDPHLRETANSTAEIQGVARCVVRTNPQSWMSRFTPTEHADAQLSGKVVEKCVRDNISGDYSVPNAILSGSIAEYLYLEGNSSLPILNKNEFYADSSDKFSQDRIKDLEFYDCVLHTDPATVDALLRSKPNGNVETDLLQRLAVTGSSCTPHDRTSIGRQRLRFQLADVVFRRSLPAKTVP